MKMKCIVTGLFCILLCGATGATGLAAEMTIDDLVLYTEEYPPLNFEQAGVLRGISVDLMDLMLKEAGSRLTRQDIELLPWARGYMYIQTDPGTGLFAMTRNAQREHLFKWVGPIAPTRIVLTAPKYRHIKIEKDQELNQYAIGVIRDDIGEMTLVERGIAKGSLTRLHSPALAVNMLVAGRIDMWAYGEDVARWLLKEKSRENSDADLAKYETVYVLKEGTNFFAFSKDVPDAIIQRLQAALDRLMADGRHQQVLDAYLK